MGIRLAPCTSIQGVRLLIGKRERVTYRAPAATARIAATVPARVSRGSACSTMFHDRCQRLQYVMAVLAITKNTNAPSKVAAFFKRVDDGGARL